MPTYVYQLTKDHLGKYRPFIPLEIINPHTRQSTKVMGLLDTGADDCVFPKVIAETTGHNLKGDGVSSSINQGVGESKVQVWNHTFKMALLSPDRKTIVYRTKEYLIGCLDHDNAPPLIGTISFMEGLVITFDYILHRINIRVP